MTVERNQIGWAIWLVWVLMTTMGYALGWFIGFFLAQVPEEFIGSSALEDILAYFIAGAVLGFGVGLMQWLLLRGYVSRAGWWVLASTVGWGLSMAVVEAFDVGLGLPVGGVVLGAVTGGAIVWLLRQPVPEA